MTAETDLLPCPFCGDEADTENAACEARAGCRGCRAKIVRQHGSHDDNGLPEAIAAWNRRAQSAEIEALRAEVDEWKDVAKCASEQQDSLFNEARALNELADNLRAEVYFRDSVIATHAADTREYQKRISQAEARAERLAEALREARRVALLCDPLVRARQHPAANSLEAQAFNLVAKIDALLREEEEGHEQ